MTRFTWTVGCLGLALLGIVALVNPWIAAKAQSFVCLDVTVRSGDTLSKLAGEIYGDPGAFRRIITATNSRSQDDNSYAYIANPNILELGWKLCAPQTSTLPAEDDGEPALQVASAPSAPPPSPAAPQTASRPAATGLRGTIPIGVLQVLSGDAGVYGRSQARAAELAVEAINRSGQLGQAELSLKVVDTQGDRAVAMEEVYRLINDEEVVAIVGPTLSNTARAVGWFADQVKIPLVTASATAEGITEIGTGRYIFRTALPDSQVIPTTVQTLKERLGLERVAVFYYLDDDFTRLSYEVFDRALAASGVEIVGVQALREGETDYRPKLRGLVGQSLDAVVVSTFAREAAQLMAQAREVGIGPEVPFIGGDGLNSGEVFALAGSAANGAFSGTGWHVDNPAPANRAFVAAYQRAYGEQPDQFAAQAYTAVQVIAQGLLQANSSERAALRDALAQLPPVDTPVGRFRFTPQGEPNYAAVVQVQRGGEFLLMNDERLVSNLKGTIPIGVLQVLSGDAGVYGRSQARAAELAVEAINRSGQLGQAELSLKVVDTQGDRAVAMEEVYRLINDEEVVAIVGPTLSNTARAVGWFADQVKIPLVTASATAEGITEIGTGRYIFRTALPDSQVIPTTVQTLKERLGLERVAVFYYLDDDFTRLSYEVFDRALAASGVEIVGVQALREGETDYRPKLRGLVGQSLDAVVVSTFAREAAQLMAQAREVGIGPEVPFIGGDGLNSGEVFALAGSAANGAFSGTGWHVDNPAPANRAFVAAYQRAYGEQPDQFAAQAYTAVQVIAQGLLQANSSERAALRDALAQLPPVDTPVGRFRFTPQGEPNYAAVVQVQRDGRFDIY